MPYAYYIYYRVNPDKAMDCETRVRKVISAVAASTGTAGRLLKKRGEPYLWMEVYEPVEDEAVFEWELADAVSRLGVLECLQQNTNRHTECFRT